MNLFDQNPIAPINLLPYDGEVFYYGAVFSVEKSNKYVESLLNRIEWKNDELIMFGKRIVTKREVAWYGDKEYEYTYSKINRKALLWTKELLEIKSKHKNMMRIWIYNLS